MESVEIRKFKGSDLEPVHSLIQQTIRECYSGIYPENAVKYFLALYTPEAILKRNASGTTFVAASSGKIVGTGSAHASEISGVFISNQSQRNGIGRKIMEHLEKSVFDSGNFNVP